jgi:protein gp37
LGAATPVPAEKAIGVAFHLAGDGRRRATMAEGSLIEWTGDTANVFYAVDKITGRRGWYCLKISPGCKNCYSEEKNRGFFNLGTRHPYTAASRDEVELIFDHDTACKWACTRLPRTIFVNSMTDTFGEFIPDSWIVELMDYMCAAPQHTFQVLTKRADRMHDMVLSWLKRRQLARVPGHIHLMVSVENQEFADKRIPLLAEIPCVRGVSAEPLLGPIPRMPLNGIHWVIVGGESGAGARPCELQWIREIRDQCVHAGVPLFFKQFGKLTNNPDASDPTAKENGGKSKGGRTLDGQLWDQMPARDSRPASGQ